MRANVSLGGNVRVRQCNADGVEVGDHRNQNLTTSGGLSLVADYLAASSPALAPNPPLYMVIGSGTQIAGRFMHKVPGETFRTPIVARDREGFGAVYHSFLSDVDNANQTIGCYGLVGGDASQLADTGTLVAIANEGTPFSKDASNTLSIDWTITASGVVSL